MLNTLKGRLYLIALLIVAPCYAFIYLSFDYSRSAEKDDLYTMARIVSTQAVQQQESIVDAAQLFLQSLALQPQIQDPDSQECRQFIKDLTHLDSRYINIGVPNAEGVLTCNGTKLSQPIHVLDRQYIQEALFKRHFSTSQVLLDRATGMPTINFAYPVVSSQRADKVVGAVVVVTSLEWWGKLLERMELPLQSVAYVLDPKGDLVASYPVNSHTTSGYNGDVSGRIQVGADGIRRVFIEHQVKNRLGQVQLTFVTGVAVDEALRAIDARYSLIFFVFSAVVIAVFLLFRVFFLNSIIKPLNTLSYLTFRIGQNEDIAHSENTGVHEMDELQRQFMLMAERKTKAEQQMLHQAQTDFLTGVGNRERFNQVLEDELKVAKVYEQNVALLLIDLDLFKEVNDTRGHQVGDEILRIMATRLSQMCPKQPMVCRLGGDEFVFLLTGPMVSKEYAHEFCDSIQKTVRVPCQLSQGELYISASVGVAIYPLDGENGRELMAAADQALYSAKCAGRNVARDFNVELKHTLLEKIELVKDMRNAISNQELYLVYQPIVGQDGQVSKFEALLRWQHPTKGLIPPDQFIGYAEESGQILEIGEWVIFEAKLALEKLKSHFGDDIQVSVNVSPLQLEMTQERKPKLLFDLLTGLNNGAENKNNGLIVEITENLFMKSGEETQQLLLDFRKHGIQVALDDFGTGYSSLSYIMNYPIDYLKIDKAFVAQLNDASSSLSLCEAMISMAHSLGILVVAEGVETREQESLLRKFGCDYLQGFYFSKPKTIEQIMQKVTMKDS